jgi:hypothetical protein
VTSASQSVSPSIPTTHKIQIRSSTQTRSDQKKTQKKCAKLEFYFTKIPDKHVVKTLSNKHIGE